MPDTVGYLILGFLVTFGILGGFVGMMVTRWRALKQDLRMLETLKHDD